MISLKLAVCSALVICSVNCDYVECSMIARGAFLTDVDRLPWKSQSELCVVRATHKAKSMGFCSLSSLHVSPFSRGVTCTRARVSLGLLILEQKWGLLVV